jgi:hypothetical protein
MMVGRGPLSGDGPHLLGDLLIGQTHGQIRAFDAFTATPTLSILTSRDGNDAPVDITPEALRPAGSPTRG